MASNSGYQYVGEPGRGLECVICLEVAEDPWQHGQCGRLLCKECLDKLGKDTPCPNCREENPQFFQDNKSKRDIQALVVKCPNDGCGETMERCDVKDHVTKCPHTLMSCKYENIGCDTKLNREYMAAHEQDDKLHLHMALETVNASKEESQTLKNKGSITVAVTDFQKNMDTDSRYASSPFYTHPRGYHMALAVDANGYAQTKGTHVTASIQMLMGKYDDELTWPFVGAVAITLLNQLENENHHRSILSFTNKDNVRVDHSYGNRAFISHPELNFNPAKNTQYLKDDTLYFKVSVEAADHKPWLECIMKNS